MTIPRDGGANEKAADELDTLDYFAGQALTMAANEVLTDDDGLNEPKNLYSRIARTAYAMAQAMLAERARAEGQ